MGVLRMALRSGRCCLEGYAELQVTEYWGHGGMRGSTGVRTVGVTGIRSSAGGALRSRVAVLGCPPDPSNNSGGMQGHPLVP